MQSFRLMCIVEFKKIQITNLRHAAFLSYVHDDIRDDVHGLLIFLYRVVDIMISVNKQMEAAEANVCRGGLQNDNEELRDSLAGNGDCFLHGARCWSCIYH